MEGLPVKCCKCVGQVQSFERQSQPLKSLAAGPGSGVSEVSSTANVSRFSEWHFCRWPHKELGTAAAEGDSFLLSPWPMRLIIKYFLFQSIGENASKSIKLLMHAFQDQKERCGIDGWTCHIYG